MSLRRRITLTSAAAVAVAVLLGSLLTYLLVSHQLRSELDHELRGQGVRLGGGLHPGSAALVHGDRLDRAFVLALRGAGGPTEPAGQPPAIPRLFRSLGPPRPGEVNTYRQLVDAHGHVLAPPNSGYRLPVQARALALARGAASAPSFANARVSGVHLRILSEAASPGYALEVARPLTDIDTTLSRLRLILALIDVGGVALAAGLGRIVAGAVLAPVKRLGRAVEHVTRTRDLSERLKPRSADELGRLAASFNAMLDALADSMSALDASAQAQRQLVADASHELRTPVTSLRANLEVMQALPDMDEHERARVLDDAVEQAAELTVLMNDIIELARGDAPSGEREDVQLDALVAVVLERHRRHAPGVRFEADLEPTVLEGLPGRLERAVSNLVDNAVKWSPPDAPIEVRLRDGELSVRDHGPGIPGEELEHVFDRFFRGADARGRPGSGLGLAIVRQVVEGHGGRVWAERPPDGGTSMRVTLPGARPVAEPTETPVDEILA